MAIKKCRPKPFEKKTYTNQDFIDEYKKLNDEWKKFSDIKDDLWQTTMRNDKRVMQLEFQVWYYEWVNDSLKKKIKQLDPNNDLSDWSSNPPRADKIKKEDMNEQ